MFEPRMHPAMNACTKVNRMRVSASEYKITDVTDRARGKKHFRLKRIFFKTVRQENNIWCLEGMVSSGLIFTTARNFKLNIECENREILSFEETRIKTRANTHFWVFPTGLTDALSDFVTVIAGVILSLFGFIKSLVRRIFRWFLDTH